MYLICSRCGKFYRIFLAKSAKETWDILVKYYEGGEKVKVVKLQALRRHYELLQMREDEKITSYVSKVHNLVHLMKWCSEVVIDKTILGKVMRTLTSYLDHVIIAIQESNNLETLKLEDLVGSLETHELWIVERKRVQDSNKHCMPRHGRRMVVPISSREKETRLITKYIGWTFKSIRLMIRLMNPRKEKNEPHIRKTNMRRKMYNAITVKSGVTWPRISGTRKTRER